jgi:hypothetical protein
MSDRVWRQLATNLPRDPSAASDTVLRLALQLWVSDPRATLSAAQRGWLRARLAVPKRRGWVPLGASEKQRLERPLLDYIRAYHPELVERVAAQFG